MATRSTFLQTPTIEIDQNRYEELIRHELQYEQYKKVANNPVIEMMEIQQEFKEGDKVKLIEEGPATHGFEVGDVCVITKKFDSVNKEAKDYEFEISKDGRIPRI